MASAACWKRAPSVQRELTMIPRLNHSVWLSRWRCLPFSPGRAYSGNCTGIRSCTQTKIRKSMRLHQRQVSPRHSQEWHETRTDELRGSGRLTASVPKRTPRRPTSVGPEAAFAARRSNLGQPVLDQAQKLGTPAQAQGTVAAMGPPCILKRDPVHAGMRCTLQVTPQQAGGVGKHAVR